MFRLRYVERPLTSPFEISVSYVLLSVSYYVAELWASIPPSSPII